jgi:large conductance mechanosensitive channel
MSDQEKPAKRGVIQEFREFAIKGNVIDLTVGVIIGAAFTKIVNSIVEDLVMPPLGIILGRVDFTDLYLILPGQDVKMNQAVESGKPLGTLADLKSAGIATVNYGHFLNNVLQFLIVAFAVFLMVRSINRIRQRLGEMPPAPVKKRPCPFCLTEIPEEAIKCAFCTSEVPIAESVA